MIRSKLSKIVSLVSSLALVVSMAGNLSLQGFAQALPATSNPLPTTVPNTLPGSLVDDSRNPVTGKPEQVAPADSTNPEGVDQTGKSNVKNEIEAPKLDPSLKKPLTVQKIVVEGVTKLSEEEVRAITAPYEGKETTLQELQENVSDKLTELYEKKGYITSLVFIPPQKIEDGVLTVKADEGVVSEILLENTRWFKRRAIMPRLSVEEGEVFLAKPLLKSLRRLNENPDLVLQATLKAGEKPGETKVVLSPKKETFPVHVTPFYDNLGRFPIGRQRLGATISDNNALGFGDTLYTSPFFTTRSFGIINGYELPLGSHGTKVGMSYAHTNFDFNRAGFDFKGRSNIYYPYVAQELVRTERVVLSTDVGLSMKGSSFEVNGTDINRDRLRVLTSGVTLRSFDKSGQWFMRHEAGIGLDVLNATIGTSPSTSRPGAGSQFFRYTGSATRYQKLPWQTYGIFKAIGQVTPNRLLSLEQFQLGGATTVRGYSEGRLIGDSAFLLSGEWRLPWRFLPDSWHVSDYKLKDNIEFVAFTDLGEVFDNHAFSGVNAKSGKVTSEAFIMSVGGGLRIRLAKYLNARLDVGIPLVRQSPDKNAARLHFGFESRLF